MKKILIILSTILMLSSCVSIKRACEFCPSTTTITTDTIHDSITIMVEVPVFIPADTTVLYDSIPCPDYDKTEKGKRGTVRVKIKDYKMTAECICDSIERKYKVKVWVDRLTINRKEEKVIEKSVRKDLSWWNKTMIVGGYIFFSLILLAVVYGIYKLLKFLKIIK